MHCTVTIIVPSNKIALRGLLAGSRDVCRLMLGVALISLRTALLDIHDKLTMSFANPRRELSSAVHAGTEHCDPAS